MPVRRSRAAALALLTALAVGSPHAQAQGALPPGMLESSPQAWETETAQAGGQGKGRYRFVGTLRCKRADEAIVGARVLRSETVDLVQIGCARIACVEMIQCGWQQLERGAYAGQPNEGSHSAIAVCPRDAVIAGFRARLSPGGRGIADFVGELQFECARVEGLPQAQVKGRFGTVLPVSERERSWLPFVVSEGLPPSADGKWPVEGHCAQRAATGVSLAVGNHGPSGRAAIQALSMFCPRDAGK